MTASAAPSRRDASVRMPPTLTPPRPAGAGSTTSFGHLISAGRPVAARTPSAAATPAASVTTGAPTPRSTTEQYSPASGAENQRRPCRPRPAVCMPATTVVPSAAPAAASSRARSFVDDTTAR